MISLFVLSHLLIESLATMPENSSRNGIGYDNPGNIFFFSTVNCLQQCHYPKKDERSVLP